MEIKDNENFDRILPGLLEMTMTYKHISELRKSPGKSASKERPYRDLSPDLQSKTFSLKEMPKTEN